MKVLGIQDYSMSAIRWLDQDTSVSWLRSFEALSKDGHECHALLKEHNYTGKILTPIRGVKYNFISHTLDADNITKFTDSDTDIILYNFCNYKSLQHILKTMQIRFPWALHIVRTHHECKRVLDTELLLELSKHCDNLIVSSVYDEMYIKTHCDIPCSVLPFCVEIDVNIKEEINIKDIDVVSSIGDNPVKRPVILDEIFSNLNEDNITTKNLIGLNKPDYIKQLKRGKIFLSTCYSEASGSRSLIEAIALGCYPVITKECESAYGICKELDIPFTTISVNDTLEDSVNVIKNLLKNNVKGQTKYIHTGKLETKGMISILKNAYTQFTSLTHPSFTKNVIRHLAYNLSLQYNKKKCPLTLNNDIPLKRLRKRLKEVLKKGDAVEQIDKIWVELGLPIDCLYGFKAKMNNDDFDFEKNCSWVIQQ